jgi:hypothetical protein
MHTPAQAFAARGGTLSTVPHPVHGVTAHLAEVDGVRIVCETWGGFTSDDAERIMLAAMRQADQHPKP